LPFSFQGSQTFPAYKDLSCCWRDARARVWVAPPYILNRCQIGTTHGRHLSQSPHSWATSFHCIKCLWT